MPPKFERKRTVRSVTVDDGLVERCLSAAEALGLPSRGNLSRILDEAMLEWVTKRERQMPPPVARHAKPKGRGSK